VAPGAGFQGCSAIAASADTVSVALADPAPPPPSGGTLADGEYDLVEARQFEITSEATGNHSDTWRIPFSGLPNGSIAVAVPFRQSLRVQAGAIESSVALEGASLTAVESVTTDGTTLSATPTCPAGAAGETLSYSAAPGALTLYVTRTLLFRFQRRAP
jgi:hypothetical protein